MTLLICRTCPRYDRRSVGDFGQRFGAAITASGKNTSVQVYKVACLGGCPEHGVAAVDGPGKARVRFTRLTEENAEAVLRAAIAHDACTSGLPDDWEVPRELADHISSVTVKREPREPPYKD